MIHVTYNNKVDFVKPSATVNVYHAVYTTSQARLKLYRLLKELDDRVLYYDSDSVIFLQKHDEDYPECAKLGNYLGQLTTEMDNPDDFITHFTSAGPKDYSFLTYHGQSSVKVKGFTLNHEASEIINRESMNEIVESGKNNEELIYKVPTMVFNKNKQEQTIVTNETPKQYKFGYDSRIIDWETYKTYPFGYCRI